MRDFKNSLTEMDKKFSNPITSPLEVKYPSGKADALVSLTTNNRINTFH